MTDDLRISMHVFSMPVDSGHDSRPRMSTPPLCTGVCVSVCVGGGLSTLH